MTLSSTNNTKLYVNPPILEVEQLQKRFEGNITSIISSVKSENPAEVDKKDVFFAEFVLASISRDAENLLYIFKAKIHSIDESAGWMYKACPSHYKKLEKDGDFMICRSCNSQVDYPQIRYKVNVVLNHDETVSTITLWNNHILNLIKTPASVLVQSVSEVDGFMPIPKLLFSIVGKTYQISSRLKDFNETYSRHTITIVKVDDVETNYNQTDAGKECTPPKLTTSSGLDINRDDDTDVSSKNDAKRARYES